MIEAACMTLVATASMAHADCSFPGAAERSLPIPSDFYATFADAAGVDQDYLLYRPDLLRLWDIRKDAEDAFVCIEAIALATCSQGSVVCVHAIATPDLAEIVLLSQTHQIGFAGDGSGEWPDLRSQTTTYDGIFEETFIYDGGQYRGLGPVKTSSYP
jgi:hypothetical protein